MADFHWLGKSPSSNDQLRTSVKGPLSSYAKLFYEFGGIPSCPLDLEILTFLDSSCTYQGYNVGAGFSIGKNTEGLVVSRSLIYYDTPTNSKLIAFAMSLWLALSINWRDVHVMLSLAGIQLYELQGSVT